MTKLKGPCLARSFARSTNRAGLAFAETGWIDRVVAIEVDDVSGVGGAVKLPFQGPGASGAGDACQNRIILQAIGARVPVERIVRRDEAGVLRSAFQIYPELAVAEDRVTGDVVAFAGLDSYTASRIESDRVSRAAGAADGCVCGTPRRKMPVVFPRDAPAASSADAIALYPIARSPNTRLLRRRFRCRKSGYPLRERSRPRSSRRTEVWTPLELLPRSSLPGSVGADEIAQHPVICPTENRCYCRGEFGPVLPEMTLRAPGSAPPMVLWRR